VRTVLQKLYLKGVTFEMKKTFWIALLVMMIVLAISVVSFGEDITLRFSWWGSQNRNNRTLRVIKLFEERYPNVKIQPEFLGYDEYWQKIAVQGAAKNLPDVIQIDDEPLFLYAGKGLLLNLDPYIEDNRLDLTHATESDISPGRYNGKLYAANNGSNAYAYVYDPELFKKAGVEEPTVDWTWEDYIEKAKKIHNALGIYADDVYYAISDPHGFLIYLRQHGQSFYDLSGKKLAYDDDSLFVDFYSMFVGLIKDGVIAPPEISVEKGKSIETSLITNQESAMVPLFSNQLIALTAAAGRPLSLTLWPGSKNQVQNGNFTKASQFFAVAENSKYPEWAVKFVDFLINDLEANKILLAERGIPISSKLREDLKPYLGDVQKKVFEYINLLAKYGSPTSPTDLFKPPAAPEVKDLLLNVYEKMIFGELTPEKAAKEFREEANKILARE